MWFCSPGGAPWSNTPTSVWLGGMANKRVLFSPGAKPIRRADFMENIICGKNPEPRPLRLGVAGLVHSHVDRILSRSRNQDVCIVGISEPNRDLARRYVAKYDHDLGIVYGSLEEMIEKTRPEAVAVFTNIHDHLKVVQCCAPRGIHLMVEKPLAVSFAHAEEMIRLAAHHKTHLLTNYETTWYASNAQAHRLIREDGLIGEPSKLVFRTGHSGPVELGCNREFLEWLTDPVLNGGGVLMDFGCYGANLSTWLMAGEEPTTVTCVTQRLKPRIYPKVEDEATIILTYPKTQAIIQASWNWNYHRKDMEAYGPRGFVHCPNAVDLCVMTDPKKGAVGMKAAPLDAGFADPFAYLAGVVRGRITPQPHDLSSPENNRVVMKILDAAKRSAETGRTVIRDIS